MKSPRPNKLKVFNLTYSIRFEDQTIQNGSESYGWCDHETQTIVIMENQTNEAMADTFQHELLHCLFTSIDTDDEEQIVSRLATGICTVWAYNPKAFKWWADLIS